MIFFAALSHEALPVSVWQWWWLIPEPVFLGSLSSFLKSLTHDWCHTAMVHSF